MRLFGLHIFVQISLAKPVAGPRKDRPWDVWRTPGVRDYLMLVKLNASAIFLIASGKCHANREFLKVLYT